MAVGGLGLGGGGVFCVGGAQHHNVARHTHPCLVLSNPSPPPTLPSVRRSNPEYGGDNGGREVGAAALAAAASALDSADGEPDVAGMQRRWGWGGG